MNNNSEATILSVIVPCFNHGKYLQELFPVFQKLTEIINCEIIIINDGSTDVYTLDLIENLKASSDYIVISKKNTGVCDTRNVGLNKAKGKYILPLDADNLVDPAFLVEAIAILNNSEDIGVVYCDRELFGEEKGVIHSGDYNMQRLMLSNFIDTGSVFRKSLFDKLGGYDPNAIIEDWEFWLRLSFDGTGFHYIPKPYLKYRVLKGSRTANIYKNKVRGDLNFEYYRQKFPNKLGPQYVDSYFLTKVKQNPFLFVLKLYIMIFAPNFFDKLVKKGKLRKNI